MTAQATPFRTALGDLPRERAPRRTAAGLGLLGALFAIAVIVTDVTGVGLPAGTAEPVLAAALIVIGVGVWRAAGGLHVDETKPWSAIGVAILMGGLGLAVRAAVSAGLLVGADEGIVGDAFSVAFYGLMALGLVRLPRVRASRIGSVRMAMDVLVGMVAAATVLWELQPDVFAAGFAIPVLHATLAGCMLVALLRRSPYVSDPRLGTLLVGLLPLVTMLGFDPGGLRTSLVWAAAAVGLGLAGWTLRRPLPRRNLILARPGRRRLILPYVPVVGLGALFATRVVEGDGLAAGILPWGMLIVIVCLVIRSWASVRESRQLVGLERDQLLASISHDLRTPLTAVAGFSEVLSTSWEQLADEERQEMIEIMRLASNSLVDIVGDMESLARSELDAAPLKLERIKGKTLISDAIKLVFELDGPLPVRAEVEPYLEIVCDHRRMVQVLRALLENALRYGNGKILIVAKRSDKGRIIEVHDNGAGVTPRYEKVIWRRFERGEHELNANVPGSGLGLAVARSIARAHEGEAGYRLSDRLAGACFYIELPYDRSLDVARTTED